MTGGTSEIDASCIARFAEEGASLVCVVTRVAEEAGTLRTGVSLRQCDVGVVSEVEALAWDVMAEIGRIDVLINNAGTTGRETAPLHNLSYETGERVQIVNARGAFSMVRTVIPDMLAQGGGSIVNVASIGSFRATPGAISRPKVR